MAERKIPAPEPNPETKAFWDNCAAGKFTVGKCKDTGKLYWYPRALSPFTLSDNTEMVEVSGKGTIYSYSVMRRSPEMYCIAYVTLDEGTTMMTNIVDTDFDSIKVGQKVKLVFKPTDGGPPVPCFTPA
ncbi:putative OB-fold protein [Constrictibacter sp. MBR-5]|jgi:uncharacterized OB-fold protein|uniref:Zn-ribbon domain-containing OB-fold protein n=1 Tax=Constrictibacter sp. MBR-5 TaxID=3156467 RepID=UPI003396076C